MGDGRPDPPRRVGPLSSVRGARTGLACLDGARADRPHPQVGEPWDPRPSGTGGLAVRRSSSANVVPGHRVRRSLCWLPPAPGQRVGQGSPGNRVSPASAPPCRRARDVRKGSSCPTSAPRRPIAPGRRSEQPARSTPRRCAGRGARTRSCTLSTCCGPVSVAVRLEPLRSGYRAGSGRRRVSRRRSALGSHAVAGRCHFGVGLWIRNVPERACRCRCRRRGCGACR